MLAGNDEIKTIFREIKQEHLKYKQIIITKHQRSTTITRERHDTCKIPSPN